jgi:two-component system chemotaxis response regulator CheB
MFLAHANDVMSCTRPDRIVVVAASAGGIRALPLLLGLLPKDFPAPIVVVQHRSPTAESISVSILERRTRLPVAHAVEGEKAQPGVVYVAAPDLHLNVTGAGRFEYSDGRRIRHVPSSANPLFASAAASFGSGAIGVVLTGYGADGTDGVQAVRAHGGVVIAQDQATSEQFGMPGSAIKTGAVDDILPLHQIPAALVRLTAAAPSPQSDVA